MPGGKVPSLGLHVRTGPIAGANASAAKSISRPSSKDIPFADQQAALIVRPVHPHSVMPVRHGPAGSAPCLKTGQPVGKPHQSGPRRTRSRTPLQQAVVRHGEAPGKEFNDSAPRPKTRQRIGKRHPARERIHPSARRKPFRTGGYCQPRWWTVGSDVVRDDFAHAGGCRARELSGLPTGILPRI